MSLFPSLAPKHKKAALVLSDGTIFPGYSFGYEPSGLSEGIIGEIVFNTAMTGYQEILTDPSYYGQIVVMTYPHIGNYGLNPEDNESRTCIVSGFVVHQYTDVPSNWRSKLSISEYLKQKKIPALYGVDTRAVTRHIRSQGAMNAFLVCPAPEANDELAAVLKRLRTLPPFGDRDMVAEVSTKEAYDWNEPCDERQRAWNTPFVKTKGEKPLVVVLDFGVKSNMLRSLAMRGCKVRVVPASTSADAILAMKPQGVLLSNGPGDPARVAHAPNTVRQLLGKVPIFGICMGHQVLAHALGAKTYKMKFGHHGANQPVYDLSAGKVMITSQNHGYAIDPETLPKNAKVTQINLNDKSVEGIALPDEKAFSVQYHPEAAPGPRDAMGYFDDFMRSMGVQ